MRTKKALLNLITDVFPMIIVSILGIFKFKLFVQVLGQEVQGLYQFFTQVMVYIAIVDGGLGSAVLHAMYRPNSAGKQEEINAILSGAKRIFSFLGIVVYGIAFLVSFLVPFFIKDNPFEYSYVVTAFLLFALSSVISYFFVPYQSLLEVKEQRYIYNMAEQLGQITQSSLEIILLLNGVDFFVILLMHSVVRLTAYLSMAFIAKKKFPEYNYHYERKDYTFKRQVKHLIFHKINGLVGSNIDVMIITSFLGLTASNVYSTYNYIVNMVRKIVDKIYTAIQAILGNILSSNKEQAYKLFRELNSMLFYIATAVSVPLVLAINSFIEIWYENMIETDLKVAYGFTGILFLGIVKIAVVVFVNAGGLFEETKKCAIADTVINFTLSLILVRLFGISGVLFATCTAVFVAEYIMKTVIIHKEIFECSSKTYFVGNIKFWAIALIDLWIGWKILPVLMLKNIFTWFLSFAIYTILNGGVLLGIYMLLRETAFMERLINLVKHKG